MRRVHAEGSVDGGHWTLKSVNAVHAPRGRMTVDTLLDISRQEVVERPGEEPVVFEGGERYRVFTVSYKTGWSVLDVEEPS